MRFPSLLRFDMSAVIGALLALLLCVVVRQFLIKKRIRPLPLPSPPGDLILGHLRYMPDLNSRDMVFYEWGRKYGT